MHPRDPGPAAHALAQCSLSRAADRGCSQARRGVASRSGPTWDVNLSSTRAVFQGMVPKGIAEPSRPGWKSSESTYFRLLLMSNTQCAAVTTWRALISVPAALQAPARGAPTSAEQPQWGRWPDGHCQGRQGLQSCSAGSCAGVLSARRQGGAHAVGPKVALQLPHSAVGVRGRGAHLHGSGTHQRTPDLQSAAGPQCTWPLVGVSQGWLCGSCLPTLQGTLGLMHRRDGQHICRACILRHPPAAGCRCQGSQRTAGPGWRWCLQSGPAAGCAWAGQGPPAGQGTPAQRIARYKLQVQRKDAGYCRVTSGTEIGMSVDGQGSTCSTDTPGSSGCWATTFVVRACCTAPSLGLVASLRRCGRWAPRTLPLRVAARPASPSAPLGELGAVPPDQHRAGVAALRRRVCLLAQPEPGQHVLGRRRGVNKVHYALEDVLLGGATHCGGGIRQACTFMAGR